MDGSMRKLIRILFGAALAASFVAVSAPTHAEIYKYRKKDGTVVYTDKLSDLPRSVRAKYAARERKKRQEQERLEASVGKAEARRRAADKERKAALERQMAQAAADQRRKALLEMIKRIDEKRGKEAKTREKWQQRVIKAQSEVDRLYAEFRNTREAYDKLAVRADFTLFPGQNQEKAKLRKKLDKLEKELDAALDELNVKIPNEARKAGVPPGWIRVQGRRNPPT